MSLDNEPYLEHSSPHINLHRGLFHEYNHTARQALPAPSLAQEVKQENRNVHEVSYTNDEHTAGDTVHFQTNNFGLINKEHIVLRIKPLLETKYLIRGVV